MRISKFFLPGLKENGRLIALSVLGAAIFWFFNAMNKSYDSRITYPLKYNFVHDSVIVMQPLATNIKIDVTSGGWNLMQKTLKINSPPVEIQLDSPTEIKFLTRASIIPLISDQLGSKGLKLRYVVIDTLFIKIEEKVTRKLPLAIDSLAIPLEKGYRLTSPIWQGLDSVVVTGPQSIMQYVSKNIKVYFGENLIDDNFDSRLGYQIQKHVYVVPNKTNVKFGVSKYIATGLTIPLETLHFPSDSSVFVAENEIVVLYTIKEDNKDDIDASDFSVILDYSMPNADSTVSPLLMYAHEKALDVVLSTKKIKLHYKQIP